MTLCSSWFKLYYLAYLRVHNSFSVHMLNFAECPSIVTSKKLQFAYFQALSHTCILDMHINMRKCIHMEALCEPVSLALLTGCVWGGGGGGGERGGGGNMKDVCSSHRCGYTVLLQS